MISTSIIIINYNTKKQLLECLESIKNTDENKKDSIEVIVVDNGSKENLDEIKKYPLKLSLILNPINLGFSKAVNIGAKKAEGEFLLILNPDTKITSEVITKMTEFYKSTPSVGIVSPKLITESGEAQKTVRKFPTVIGAFNEYLLKKKNYYDFYIPADKTPIVVDTTVGACMLIKRTLFESLGGFSEKYFLYYEDIDLCKRIADFGLKTYYLPNISVFHKVGVTHSPDSFALLVKSSKIYHGILGYSFILIIIKLDYVLKNLSRQNNGTN